jgi:hypothetical protein
MSRTAGEFEKFDSGIKTILSISKEELKRREEAWKKNKEGRKQAKISPVSRASRVKD